MRLFEGTEFDVPPKCERCGKLEEECNCPPPPPERRPASEQKTTVRSEKRKRGKVVTIVEGLQEPDTNLRSLTKQLKDTCGSGGTLKDSTIEIQGDQKKRVAQALTELGYQVREI